MEEDKNIRLTIVKPENEYNEEVEIDLRVCLDFLKRLFTVWLAVSVAAAAILGGFGILLRDKLSSNDAVAVISFSDSGGNLKQTPDVEKLASAAVVGRALDSLEITVSEMDNIRANLSIEAVLPDAVMDQRTVYYQIYSGTKGDIVAAAEKLLSTGYTSSRYILRFDYQKAGYTREDGVKLLNALVESYQQYFLDTYTDRPLLGSMSNVIDYQNYDYAEAAEIFTDLLSSIKAFLSKYAGSDFRSSQTGYTVSDLIRLVNNLQEAELDRVSAVISENSVFKRSAEDVVSYYNWRIKQNLVEISVQEAKASAQTTAVENYQKDPLLYVVGEIGTMQGPGGELNGVYDELISDLLETQTAISAYTSRNQAYQELIDRVQEKDADALPADIARVEQYLAALNGKIGNLVDLVNRTMDDYFTYTLSGLLQVQLPATAEVLRTVSPALIKLTVILEALVFFAYCGTAFALAMGKAWKEAARKKAEQAEGAAP